MRYPVGASITPSSGHEFGGHLFSSKDDITGFSRPLRAFHGHSVSRLPDQRSRHRETDFNRS